ncbi:MAG: hypothetical protein A2Y17_04485 [Clostridiales bacterium GWF2_38_85]|nr:MAG: hypothetical protein A2Y17_04485 [Clostridiales bacterium GWF2_38_85]
MELQLGATIRKLRTEKAITQEELAEYVGVSFQAVSKWETNTTMPDITLLPKLAVFFGVSIDALFSVNTDDELERIDYMFENEHLTDQNFVYAKRTLDAILKNNENDVEALKRYAMLYMRRNNRDNLAAGRIIEKAINLSPLNDELYSMYRQVRGGDNYFARSGNGWFIRFCEPYAKKYPSNINLLGRLIDAYIEMRYFDRALDMIETLKIYDSNGMVDIFKGDLLFAQGYIDEAKAIWRSVDKTNIKLQYEIGERFNRVCDYEKAIEFFENAFSYAKKPRDLSSTYSLAFLYTALEKYQKAIEMWERILEVQKSDWNITEGTQAEWSKAEIAKLKSKL